MATVTTSDRSPPPLGDYPEEGTWIAPPVPDDSFYEVVDGQIVELPPMGVYECGIASFLALALGPVINAQRLGRVIVETLFWLDRSGKLKRRPDLAFVSAETWPLGKRLPKTEAWDVIPDLAVEVVSESNSANEILIKLADYFRAGVKQVWVVYPETRQVYVYASPTSVRILSESDSIDGGDIIPGFRVSLIELFGDPTANEESGSTPS